MAWRKAFWRFAHRRYQIRKPSVLREALAFAMAGWFGLLYAVTFWKSPLATLQVWPGVVGLVCLPLLLALAHRAIRLERAKGPDALYRKRLASGR